jgi:hypothetical protein
MSDLGPALERAVARAEAAERRAAELEAALPDPLKLRLLAAWFGWCGSERSAGDEVQRDLLAWADSIERVRR